MKKGAIWRLLFFGAGLFVVFRKFDRKLLLAPLDVPNSFEQLNLLVLPRCDRPSEFRAHLCDF